LSGVVLGMLNRSSKTRRTAAADCIDC
jgi:hypothetical protein